MWVAVDAMGGDHAPEQIIRGAVEALELLDEQSGIVLVGKQESIRAHLAGLDGWQGRVLVEPASQVIGMEEVPIDAIRQKRDSSIMRMVELVATGQADATVSAGNTGACAAACQLRLKTLPGVDRPGIAVVVPSLYGPIILCDVGANIAPKPRHLHQYALMCAIYSEHILGTTSPRIGLLSVGQEDVKGPHLVKQAGQLLRQDRRLNFVGNIEGRDLFRDMCDVVICDGFVGNIVLKLTEGLAEGLLRTIRHELTEARPELGEYFDPVVRSVWARHDYSEYGGAPLLGVNGVCIICHGASDHRAIRNAVQVAGRFVREGVNAVIVEHLAQAARVDDD
ncbi:MAG: phosphate acyltransferase PlsX [Phycisphaerae bacterium]